jgi:RNA polymerase sigma-70 factor (ECF subfamily)
VNSRNKTYTGEQQNAEKQFRDNFESIYFSYYPGMVRFAKEYVGCKEDAENIVHDAFAEIWEGRKGYQNRMNFMLAFLFATIKNKCIDYLRHQIVVRETEDILQETFRLDMQMKFDSLESFNQDLFSSGERIEHIIGQAIDALPEQCRKIFIMNKLEGKKQKDIARELNISVNTVESQMGIAYKKLKESLKGYLPLLVFFAEFIK